MRRFLLLLCWGFFSYAGWSQDSLKVMQYNLLRYGNDGCGPTVLQKDAWLKTILTTYAPDILLANELIPNVGAENRVLAQSTGYTSALAVSDIFNSTGADIENAAFYRTDKLGYLGGESLPANPREISIYKFYYKPALPDSIHLYTIVVHLKASNSNLDQQKRNDAAKSIIAWMAEHPNENVVLGGDFNIKTHSEAAFQTLITFPDPGTRFVDPLDASDGWSGASHAKVHTQSTRLANKDCGATGGLDDRFDMILISPTIDHGEKRISYISGSYQTIGNDGDDFDMDLVCSNSPSVSSGVCDALVGMSDHLPIMLSLNIEKTRSTGQHNWVSGFFSMRNPMGEELVVYTSGKNPYTKPVRISLLDLLGRQVFEKEEVIHKSITFLPIPSLHPGSYIARIVTPKGVFQQRLVKY